MKTYTILIDEQQREVLQNALACYISDGFDDEVDSNGCAVARMLKDMLDPTGLAGPLSTTAINSFVL
jgi:hypothetical protein